MESLGHPSFSHPQTKNHCWSVRSSMRKEHFHDCMSRPGDLKCQGTGGPDGHQRDQLPGSTAALCCSFEFVWKHPQPRDLNRESGTASLKALAGGGENRLSSARVKTPPPAAHSGSNSCPVTPGFAHLAPSPTGNELGKADPQS